MILGLPNYFEKRVKKWTIAWKKSEFVPELVT